MLARVSDAGGVEVFWIVLMALGLAALTWFAFRSDPHWVARDGRAFTCRIQYLDGRHMPVGRWREARAFIHDGALVVHSRRALRRSHGQRNEYRIVKRAENPPRNRVTYLIDGRGPHGATLAVFRVPANSRALPHIESVLER
jgi:hypothetical protein